MLWRIAVCEPHEFDSLNWHNRPATEHWQSLMRAARRMPAGKVYTGISAPGNEMYLAFNEDLGVLVHYGRSESRRVVFPHRPAPPAEPCDWYGLDPWDFLESHGFPRAEAFGLLHLFLSTGELPTAVPRPNDRPCLPGMEEVARSDEWWRVVWAPAGEW